MYPNSKYPNIPNIQNSREDATLGEKISDPAGDNQAVILKTKRVKENKKRLSECNEQ